MRLALVKLEQLHTGTAFPRLRYTVFDRYFPHTNQTLEKKKNKKQKSTFKRPKSEVKSRQPFPSAKHTLGTDSVVAESYAHGKQRQETGNLSFELGVNLVHTHTHAGSQVHKTKQT